MTDLLERLRVAVITEVSPTHKISVITNLGEEAADTIESLRRQIAEANEAMSQALGALKALCAENGYAAQGLIRALPNRAEGEQ